MKNAPVILAIASTVAACNSGTSPSVLDHATLLAVRSQPPRIEAGERAKIVALASQEDGAPIVLDRPVLSAKDLPEELAARMIETDDEGSFVVAPPAPALEQMREQLSLPADAPIPLMIELDVRVSEIVEGASKVVLLGGRAENPRIIEVTIDSVPVDNDRASVALGTEPKLAVRAEGRGDLAISWHASVAELENYRSIEATMLASTAGRGHVVVVVRDPSGGVDWRIIDTEVR